MLAAYADNATYFYMVNDDTIMVTPDWTETFIGALSAMHPSNLGVVGPAHSGGNTGILTYHFLHRTHIDIFHYFYPRNFTGWYADDWITRVYKPNNSAKLESVKLKHMMQSMRYEVQKLSEHLIMKVINETHPVITTFLQAKTNSISSRNYINTGSKYHAFPYLGWGHRVKDQR